MTTPRRGIVLGAGGVLGFAWMAGALAALGETHGVDPRDAEVLVGTSAGSCMAALLGSGAGVDAVVAHQRGEADLPGAVPISYDHDRDGSGPLPPRPALRPGSPGLAVRTALHPRRHPPMVRLAGLLPAGRGTHDALGGAIADVSGGGWATHPGTWIVAMDYDNGRRVAFGRDGSPGASLADAVMASCSIPGWYAPVDIDGRRYVDGGTCSSTSLDLLADSGLDEVLVLAPMASLDYDSARGVARLERGMRRLATRRLLHEARRVKAGGTKVTIIAPGPEDLAGMGANLMDPRRRRQVLETSLRTSVTAWTAATSRLAEVG